MGHTWMGLQGVLGVLGSQDAWSFDPWNLVATPPPPPQAEVTLCLGFCEQIHMHRLFTLSSAAQAPG